MNAVGRVLLFGPAGPLEIHTSRARTELFYLGASEIPHREEQIRRRLFFGDDVAIALHSTLRATH
jgi:hypothetical protein